MCCRVLISLQSLVLFKRSGRQKEVYVHASLEAAEATVFLAPTFGNRHCCMMNDLARQDSLIYDILNSRALNKEPVSVWLTHLIFMQAYIMALHGWHARAVNTSKHSSLFCQSDIAYNAGIITKHRNKQGIQNALDNMRLDSCFI